MLKGLIRPFLDGVIAGILNFYVGTLISSFIPLPPIISSAISMGILVLIVDFILREIVHL